jgi:hypothetical protein
MVCKNQTIKINPRAAGWTGQIIVAILLQLQQYHSAQYKRPNNILYQNKK